MSSNANSIESFILHHSKLSIILIYNIVVAGIELVCWRLIPFLLSYPPNFSEISNRIGTSTLGQYIIILIASVFFSTLVFNKALKGMDEWEKVSGENQEDIQKVGEIREKCLNLPYKIFWSQIIIFNVPIIFLTFFVKVLNNISIVIVLKIVIIGLSISSIMSVVLYAVFRRIFKKILLKTYVGLNNEGFRIGIKNIIFIQIIPLIIASIFITALLGYSRLIDEKDDYIYAIYKAQIQALLKDHKSFKDSNEVIRFLKYLNYENTKPFYFTQTSNDKIVTSNNSMLSVYLSYYIRNPYNGDRIFDVNMETQGIVLEIPTETQGTIRAGVIFRVVSDSTVHFFLINFFILLILNVFALYYVLKTFSDDISVVTEGLVEIIENDTAEQGKKIPVTSNDEISDLVIAFNKIRERQFEYDKLKTEFMANVSHELRTPVNVIFTAIQLFESYVKSDLIKNFNRSKKNLKIIKQNCLRLTRLINNLIDTTKIDAGFLKLQLQSLNIISFVKELAVSVTEYAKIKGIAIKFEAETEEKIVSCDIDKIETVILNLLSNAIKFNKQGGSIFVKVLDRGDNIAISVRDTGIGIPFDKQKIIFERFRQVEQSLVRNYEGSGIGLSLVKALVEMHNGRIFVESEEGEGSEFVIELPVNIMDADSEASCTHVTNISSNADKINIEFSDIYLSN